MIHVFFCSPKWLSLKRGSSHFLSWGDHHTPDTKPLASLCLPNLRKADLTMQMELSGSNPVSDLTSNVCRSNPHQTLGKVRPPANETRGSYVDDETRSSDPSSEKSRELSGLLQGEAGFG